jgi:hypothetical protein
MEISLNLRSNFNLPIYCNLVLLPDDKVFSAQHKNKFRHPADIFLRRFKEIVNSLNELKSFLNGNRDYEKLERALKQYLHSLDTFYDNLFNIIVCLKPPSNGNMNNALQWLKENGYKEGKKLRECTLTHHRLISSIVNKIKHDDPEINPISLTWDNGVEVTGFFIGSIVDGEYIGPDPHIHKPYKGLSTAFSFNHFILKTIGLVYLYSYELNRIIFDKKKTYCDKKNDEFYRLAEFALQIKPYFFPDEYDVPAAKLKKTDNKILIKYPYKYKNKKPKKDSWKVDTFIRCNSRTNKGAGKIPYFGKPK